MNRQERDALEAELRAAAEVEDWEQVAALAIRGYGPELLGFLLGERNYDVFAEDVYAEFLMNIWRGLRGFRWESTFRTWAYVVVRNTNSGFNGRNKEKKTPIRAGRCERLPTRELNRLANEVRANTLLVQQVDAKSRVARIREQLEPDERALLILRVDRDMAWKDVSEIMGEEPNTLAQRYLRLKDKIHKLAKKEGIVPTQ